MLINKAWKTLRTGGVQRLGQGVARFSRRRYYRLASYFEKMRAGVEALDMPVDVVAGCMYQVRVRVANKSTVSWNSPADRSPRIAAAALFLEDGAGDGGDDEGIVLEGPHTLLPDDFRPGDSSDITLILEAPRHPGNYRVRTDLVRENCYWFSDLHRDRFQPITVRVAPHSDALLAARIPAIDITMDITNRCPLRCIQCRKTYSERPEDQRDLDFELFRRIAADIFPHARSVMLSSAGEPLMSRNFLDAIELTRSCGVQDISFITSGLHLNPARAEKIVDMGVRRIEFSIDGASAAVYNKIRVGSNFDRVIANIENLNRIKKEKQSDVPLLRFNLVLMRSNIEELPDYVDMAARLGVEEVQAQHMVVFSDVVRDEALVFHKSLSNACIERARLRAEAHGIRFFHPPLFRLAEPPQPANDKAAAEAQEPEPGGDGGIWVEKGEYAYERKTHATLNDGMQICTDPWRKFYIDWQGMVFPCCMWKEQPLGDLRKQTFEEIWKSSAYGRLRASLTGGKLGRSCSECSVITGGNIDNEGSYFFSTGQGTSSLED